MTLPSREDWNLIMQNEEEIFAARVHKSLKFSLSLSQLQKTFFYGKIDKRHL